MSETEEKKSGGISEEIIEKMLELGAQHEIRMMERSFHNLDRKAQKRRLEFVMRLSHALVEIEKERRACTMYCRGIIEFVMMGNYERAAEFARDFRDDPGFFGLPESNHLKPFLDIMEELEATMEAERASKH